MKTRLTILVLVVSMLFWVLAFGGEKEDYQKKFDEYYKVVLDAQSSLDKANEHLNGLLKEMDKKGLTLNPSAYRVVEKPPVVSGVPPASDKK